VVQENSQTIGLFLDCLPGDLRLCEPIVNGDGEPTGYYTPTRLSIERVLADYYGIDLRRLNDEKDAMLRAIRRG
jgi:hypothetical protein